MWNCIILDQILIWRVLLNCKHFTWHEDLTILFYYNIWILHNSIYITDNTETRKNDPQALLPASTKAKLHTGAGEKQFYFSGWQPEKTAGSCLKNHLPISGQTSDSYRELMGIPRGECRYAVSLEKRNWKWGEGPETEACVSHLGSFFSF